MEKEYTYLYLDPDLINNNYSKVQDILKNGTDIINLLIEEAENNNLFALYELGNIYSAGLSVEPNNDLAISYYKKIVEDDKVQSVNARLWDDGGILGGIRLDDPQSHINLAEMWLEDWHFSCMVGDVCSKLGYYYKNSTTDRNAAFYYLRAALSHGFNCLDAFKEVSAPAKKDDAKITTPPPNTGQTSIQTISGRDCLSIKESLINDFGKENWEKLNDNSKLSLITCIFCYEQLSGLDDNNRKLIDFTAAVLPCLKVLEEELGNRFWIKYYEFYQTKFPDCNEFIRINKLDTAEKIFSHEKIIYKNKKNNTFHYVSNPCLFTLGNFSFLYGMHKFDNGTRPDTTAIMFCKERLFKSQYRNDDFILTTLLTLRDDVNALKKIRNDSAHGGKAISLVDATDCINELLLIKKILKRILDICTC